MSDSYKINDRVVVTDRNSSYNLEAGTVIEIFEHEDGRPLSVVLDSEDEGLLFLRREVALESQA